MEVTLEFISFESVSWETKVLGGGSDDEGPSGEGTAEAAWKPGPRPGSVTAAICILPLFKTKRK